jgi:hypothetical protein
VYFFWPHSVIAFFCISTRPIPLSPIVPLPFIQLNIYAHLLFTIVICRKHRNLYAQTFPNKTVLYFYFLSLSLWALTVPQKKPFFSTSFLLSCFSLLTHHIYNGIWDPCLSFTNSVSYYLMTLIFRDIYGEWDGTVITSRETEQNASLFEDKTQTALFKDPVRTAL